ncbi:MAG: S8 family peptidase, partial [Chitinophagales bacterium]
MFLLQTPCLATNIDFCSFDFSKQNTLIKASSDDTVQDNYQQGKLYVRVLRNVNISYQTQLSKGDSIHRHDKTLLDTHPLEKQIKQYGIYDIQPAFKLKALSDIYLVQFSANETRANLIQSLQKLRFVRYAEGVPIHRTQLIPNDLNTNQWHLEKINAPQAWDLNMGNSDVVIAIVDDAVLLNHEDLENQIWENTAEIPNNGVDDDENGYVDDLHGWDASDEDNNPNPPSNATVESFSHGTHCAGIAAAQTNNNKGIASIGFGVKIMAVKTASSGDGFLDAAVAGVAYAIAANADIISMSWGSYGHSQTEQILFNVAHEKGIVLVAAAGNEDTDDSLYPAAYNHVISVAASNSSDKRANFSNYGSTIDLIAPGTQILSTVIGGIDNYDYFSGTSMATPLVAGLSALLLSANSSLSPTDIESCMKTTALNIDANNGGFEGKLGAGRINAAAALACAMDEEIPNTPTAQISGSQTINLGETATLNITFTGQAPFSFNYSNETSDTTINDLLNSSYSFSVAPTSSTTYTLNSMADATQSGTVSGSAIITVLQPQTEDDPLIGCEDLDAGEDRTLCLGESTQLQATGGTTYSWSPTMGLDNPNSSTPIATPNMNTIYTVTSMDSNGCKSETEVRVFVSSLPYAPPIFHNLYVCDGETLQLQLTDIASISNYTYKWSPSEGLNNPNIPNPVASLTRPMTYTLTTRNFQGCTNEQEVVIQFLGIDHLDVSDAQICEGESITLHAGTNYENYLWSTGETSEAIELSQPGTYGVTVSTGRNCLESTTFSISLATSP